MFGAMEDYPQTLAEFERRFAKGDACRKYLTKLRWADGFRHGQSLGGPRDDACVPVVAKPR